MGQRVSHGADAEALDDIAVALRRQGDLIDDVGGRGSAHLEKLRAAWDGPDFEEFAKRWRRAHRLVDEASQAIRAYSKLLAMESDDQRRSSSGPSSRPADLGHRGAGGSGGGGRDHGGPAEGIARAGDVGSGGGRDHGGPVEGVARAGEAQWEPAQDGDRVGVAPALGLGQWEPADIGRPAFGLLEAIPPRPDGGELVWDEVRTDEIVWSGPGRPTADSLTWDPVEVTRWDDLLGDPSWIATGDWRGPR